MDYNIAKNSFEEYVKKFDLTNKSILEKYHHTYKVVRLMEKLALKLHLSEEEITLAKIIGLLHDIGRFKQIKDSQEINDIKTNIDHAKFGCDYLFLEKHIRDFISFEKYDDIIYKAILNHNKLFIDKDLKDKSLLFAKMIRDVDKIDIFRVLAINYDYELVKEEVTDKVLERFKSKSVIERKILKTKSDDTLCCLAFIYDINFLESFELLEDSDNLGLFISSLNIPKYSEDFAENIIKEVNKKLEKSGYNAR